MGDKHGCGSVVPFEEFYAVLTISSGSNGGCVSETKRVSEH